MLMFIISRVSFVLYNLDITISLGDYYCEIAFDWKFSASLRVSLSPEITFHQIYFVIIILLMPTLLLLSPLLPSILSEYKRILPFCTTLSEVRLGMLESYLEI